MPKPTELAPPTGDWRLDFRLLDDLPEDSVVGRRFMANAIAGTIAGAALLACAWSGYSLWATLNGIADWESRIAGADGDVRQIDRLQRAYSAEASRIDEIHRLVHYPLPMTTFVAELAKSLPRDMVVDMIETKQNALVVRGRLNDNSEKASREVGKWVTSLTDHEVLGPPFQAIKLTDLERFEDGDGLVFEITLTPR